MIKTILKEGIIVILLCIAILLILSILFYDYNPIAKVIPNKIAYTAPEDIKGELEEEVEEEQIQIQNKVYMIEGSDLNIYKKSNTYNPSKENPFISTPVDSSTTSSDTVNTNIANNSGNNNSSNNSNNNSSGTSNSKVNEQNSGKQNSSTGLK